MKHYDKSNSLLPEKIYINSNIENRTWLIGKGDTSFIEYIRTDVFIEKACAWLRNNSHNYANNALGKEYLVNDFKNYIKGE